MINVFSSGFQLSTDVLSILILRYMRKDGTLRFGDFVSAILHLSVAFSKFHPTLYQFYNFMCIFFVNTSFFTDIFESKDPLQNGSVKMSLAEV